MEKSTGIISRTKQGLAAAVASLSVMMMSIVPSYCGAFEMASSATQAFTTKFVELAKKLLPFSLVVLIVLILVTHDQKKLEMELKTALMICVAYVALLIVSNAGFLETFEGLF